MWHPKTYHTPNHRWSTYVGWLEYVGMVVYSLSIIHVMVRLVVEIPCTFGMVCDSVYTTIYNALVMCNPVTSRNSVVVPFKVITDNTIREDVHRCCCPNGFLSWPVGECPRRGMLETMKDALGLFVGHYRNLC